MFNILSFNILQIYFLSHFGILQYVLQVSLPIYN
jgi:hypothetical protein